MAKVDVLKLNVGGKEYQYNINVGKAGIFTCHIDHHVAHEIGLDRGKLEFAKLSDLESFVYPKYHDYLKSKTEETLWIGIKYKVCGEFAKDPSTQIAFVSRYEHGRDKVNFLDDASFNDVKSRLGLEFMVLFRESKSTGAVTWYNARKDSEGKFYKNGSRHGVPSILIPYSQEALETLEFAEKSLQKISFQLFHVFSKDTQELIEVLEGGKLLGAPKTQE